MNTLQLLQKAVKKWPDNIFLVRENITYLMFWNKVCARAKTLYDFGIKKGDVIGILSHNIPEFPLTVFAVWYLGATVLLLDTNLTTNEYDNMTERVKCKVVCAEKRFFYENSVFKFFDIETSDKESEKILEPADITEDDIATMSFTSGSTGIPKVVPLTHKNLVACADSMKSFSTWVSYGDVMYAFLPLYHVFGFAIGLLTPLQYGTCILLQATVNPKSIMDDFRIYKPQVIPAVPRLWELFRNKIIENVKAKKKWWLVSFILKNQKWLKKIGLGGLVKKVQAPLLSVFGGRAKLLIAGGAATKPEVEKFYEQLGLTFVQGYGMTETVGPICCSRPVKKRFAFAFGAPIGCNECEIRNPDSKGIGTLWVRGSQVFTGYLNNKTENENIFDERGFFNTGDLVYQDKNGEYHFAGRKKNVIVLDSGKNVYPDELEGILIRIDGVKNVAVFEHKVKDKTVVYAVFSVEEGVTADKLINSVRIANVQVASYKWVTHFAMTTEELPMTSTQKVKHHVVRQNLIDGKYIVCK